MHSTTMEIVPTGLCLFRKQVLPGSRNSVMICKKPVTQKYGHRRVKPPVIETQAGISAEGCLCCSTKLITLLRQQGRSPAGGGGRRPEPGRVDVRLWGICFSPRHLTEKLTSGTTSWASAQSMEEPLGIHNVGWWLTVRACVRTCVHACVRAWCINRQDRPATAGAHYDHLWFTAACTFYRAVNKSVDCAVRHTTLAPIRLTYSISVLFTSDNKIPMHADESRWSAACLSTAVHFDALQQAVWCRTAAVWMFAWTLRESQ